MHNQSEGVNFTVRGGDHLSFDLELDGTQILTRRIFLGAGAVHPLSNPFTIPR